ncbi:SDR family NAD(P)-dependent oxidoreductase [Sphingobium aromaticiconvertens]|uniref:SDR family NAD(P)-dependent oxidoreductase n=1 Tax=Sphingobium aromaticiconvertens TaxID=365341 RepID=UPI00301803D1
MRRVAGKVCIVTGAASGLGAADARRLAEEGASVVLTDVAEDAARAVAASIPGAHNTPMMGAAFEQGEERGRDEGGTRLLADPADLVNLVLFLASDESRNITGTYMVSDNRETMR